MRAAPLSLIFDTDRHTLYSGSRFLKHWMDFLEENADLRYPDAGDLLE